MEKLKKSTLAGVAEKIECPTLITWGSDTGGFEHCQADNRQVGTDYIADWLTSRLDSEATR
jgi:hypothetical protein